jgi:4-coumarate--CoA ligase
MTPANSAYNEIELLHQLKLSKTKAIIAEKNALKTAVSAAEKVGIPKSHILVVEEPTSEFRCWKDILVDSEDIPLEPNDPNSIALLPFSSGTTGIAVFCTTNGRPSEGGNAISSKYCLSHLTIQRYRRTISISSRCFLWSSPILSYWVPPLSLLLIPSGLNFTLLLSMVVGLKVVVMRRFELEKWLQTVQKYGVTYAHVAPPISHNSKTFG